MPTLWSFSECFWIMGLLYAIIFIFTFVLLLASKWSVFPSSPGTDVNPLKEPLLFARGVFMHNVGTSVIEAFLPASLVFSTAWLGLSMKLFLFFLGIPFIILAVNAIELGKGTAWAVASDKVKELRSICPHGAVEIPALVGSAALGISLLGRAGRILVLNEASTVEGAIHEVLVSPQTLEIFFFLLGLYAVAAAIEAYISPRMV